MDSSQQTTTLSLLEKGEVETEAVNVKTVKTLDVLQGLGFDSVASKLVSKVSVRQRTQVVSDAGYKTVVSLSSIQRFLEDAARRDGMTAFSKPFETYGGASAYLPANLQFVAELQHIIRPLGGDYLAYKLVDNAFVSMVEAVAYNTSPSMSFVRINSPEVRVRIAYALIECPLSHYPGIPPAHILELIRRARDSKVFDFFTIATFAKLNLPAIIDPIVFGRVKGLEGRFYIGQWDTDISLDDLI